jgi:hypothetical protein
MFKPTLTAILLGLAVASHAALAADTDSTRADRSQKQERQTSEQKKVDDYWRAHNDEDRLYNLNP